MSRFSKHLSNKDFFPVLQEWKGLIPISIDSKTLLITWMDLGAYHFYEGFFHKSLITFGSLKETIRSYTTDLSVLENEHMITNYIYPSGYIFHAGRCRSTLLSKALGRSRNHLVLSEAAPINQLLEIFNKNGRFSDENSKKIFRNLVLSMCRRRTPVLKHSFIKFTSYNICHFDFIHSVFPDVPSIFLSRTISEIVASFRQSPAAWINEENSGDLENIISNFFQHAELASPAALQPVDYKLLVADNFAQILSIFNITACESQLELMKSQFAYDSKVEFNKKLFSRESN